MSQDLLKEFSSFSQPPQSDHRRTVSSVSPSTTNPFPPRRPFQPQPFHGHRQTASSSTFDDLLGLSPLPGALNRSAPRPPFPRSGSSGERRAQRPMSYGGHGAFGGTPNRSPGGRELDPFDAFNEGFGSGGGRPRTPRGSRRVVDDFSDFTKSLNATPATSLNLPRRSSRTPGLRPVGVQINMTPSIMDDDDDEFGDFISTPTATPPPSSSRANPKLLPNPPRAPVVPETLPVPPVALLLTLFPPLFSLPSTALMNRLTPLSFAVRQRALATPEVRRFLAAVSEMGRVCGRIIAGRQRRRKRAIGRGGSTQHEVQQEEREVKEVIRLWQENSGRLKAAMKEAVPELPEEAWRGPGTGGVRCRLCGLEESELIPGLKENRANPRWWDWGWGGHGTCKAFWERHGKELRGKK